MSDAFWWPHRVLVRPLLTGAGRGTRLAEEPAESIAEVDDSQRLVRGIDKREVISSARVTVPLNTNVPLGSEVTIWPGRANERTAAVIASAYQDNGDGLDSQLVLTLE